MSEEDIEQQEFPTSNKGIVAEEAPALPAPDPAPDFSSLKIGTRALFVLRDGNREGESRPFDVTYIHDQAKGLVNGRVLTDFHDFTGAGQDGLFIENCEYDANNAPGSWHWIV